MLHTILEDIRAVKRNDPSADGWLEVVLYGERVDAPLPRTIPPLGAVPVDLEI